MTCNIRDRAACCRRRRSRTVRAEACASRQRSFAARLDDGAAPCGSTNVQRARRGVRRSSPGGSGQKTKRLSNRACARVCRQHERIYAIYTQPVVTLGMCRRAFVAITRMIWTFRGPLHQLRAVDQIMRLQNLRATLVSQLI